MHADNSKPAGGVPVSIPMLIDLRSDPFASPPAHDVLAVGLCVLYAPFTSDPDRDGRRHRVFPGAFLDSITSAVPFFDERGDGEPITLAGDWRFVDVAAGVRLEVFDAKIVKRLGKGGPFGLALKWLADEWRTEHGVAVTVRGTIIGVAVVTWPAYDGAELRIVR